MSSPVLAGPELRGRQEPRVLTVPPSAAGSALEDVLTLWDLTGRRLDPWQENSLEAICAVDAAGRWAATEAGLLVSRQQGKGEVLQAYELAHLFVWPSVRDDEPKVILHTAHQFSTADAHYRKLKRRIMATPWMRRRLKGGGRETAHGISGISTGMGKRTFELENGTLLVLQSRTGEAGVGLTVDVLVVDEAQESPSETMEALLFTMDGVPNPQVLYTGTVPTETQDGDHFEGVRDRGRAGTYPRTAWVEFSPDGSDDPDLADAIDVWDRQVWVQSNPGLGYRLSPAAVEDRLASLGRTSPEGVRRQRFSIWPSRRPDEHVRVNDFDLDAWTRSAVQTARHGTTVAISAALGPAGGYGSVCIASRTADGRIYIEHRATAAQTRWVPEKVAELKEALPDALVVLDAKNCAQILEGLSKQQVKPLQMVPLEIAAAYGQLLELVASGEVVHRGQEELTLSFQHAKPRNVSTYGSTWEQSDPTEPATQALAATHAVWGVHRMETDQTSRPSGRAYFSSRW